MIRSEKLYRYAAEFIECELKTIDRALMRTDSEERRDDPRLDKEPTDEEMDAIVGRYIDDPDDVMPLED